MYLYHFAIVIKNLASFFDLEAIFVIIVDRIIDTVRSIGICRRIDVDFVASILITIVGIATIVIYRTYTLNWFDIFFNFCLFVFWYIGQHHLIRAGRIIIKLIVHYFQTKWCFRVGRHVRIDIFINFYMRRQDCANCYEHQKYTKDNIAMINNEICYFAHIC